VSNIRLHLCGITTDGKLWHTSRPSDDTGPTDSWDPWEEVKAPGAMPAGPFVSVACGVRDVEDTEELHVCAVTQDGGLWYTNLAPPDDWRHFEDLKTVIPGDWTNFHVQGVTFGHSFLDVCVLVLTPSSERRIMYTHRHFDGTWDAFQDVNDPQHAGFPGSFISAGCANLAPQPLLEELHICGVTQDGKLWHTLRSFRIGSLAWLPFAEVQALSADGPGQFTKVSIAQGISDSQGIQDLHVFTQAAGDLWHTLRFSNPSGWQSAFDPVEKQTGDPGSFGSISCANVVGQLHVCGVTADGKLWHTIGNASDPVVWSPFEDVTAAGSTPPGAFGFVSLAIIFLPPGREGEDPACQSIRQGIANDRLQIQMLQQSNPNDPAIAGCQQDIAWLQGQGQQRSCPSEDFM
jgi:hypothetical protein